MGYAEEKPWTLGDFLAWERVQPEKYEFVGGVVRMMAGGTNDRRTVILNLGAWLKDRVRPRGCRAFVEGPRVLSDDMSAYPDVTVVCGAVEGKDDFVDAPVLIAEVLSPSTEAFDRGAKWLRYQGIPSLRHYLLISQDAAAIDLFSREGDRWSYSHVGGLDSTVALPALGLAMPLRDLYQDTSVTLPTAVEQA
jgi:Uma2 family endonuclease